METYLTSAEFPCALIFELGVCRVAAAVRRLSKGWVTRTSTEPVCFIDQWLSAACLQLFLQQSIRHFSSCTTYHIPVDLSRQQRVSVLSPSPIDVNNRSSSVVYRDNICFRDNTDRIQTYPGMVLVSWCTCVKVSILGLHSGSDFTHIHPDTGALDYFHQPC